MLPFVKNSAVSLGKYRLANDHLRGTSFLAVVFFSKENSQDSLYFYKATRAYSYCCFVKMQTNISSLLPATRTVPNLVIPHEASSRWKMLSVGSGERQDMMDTAIHRLHINKADGNKIASTSLTTERKNSYAQNRDNYKTSSFSR